MGLSNLVLPCDPCSDPAQHRRLMLYRVSPVKAGRYDDFDHRVQFVAPWLRDTQFGTASNHSLRYSDVPDAVFRIAFHGSEISWVHTAAANRGIAAVFVDGKTRGEIDLYSPQTQWQRRAVFQAPDKAHHIFEIRVLSRKNPQSTGGFVDVDALIVR
jgi:alpha-L-fucosidase 2